MSILIEDTAKLRALVAWLRRLGERTRVGDWYLDADCVCVKDDDGKFRGDIAGLITTEYLKVHTADWLEKTGYALPHCRTAICGAFGVRGEFYESLVDVDDVLTDFPALHDKITCADYATTIEKYLDRGIVGEVSWRWYTERLLASVPS